MLTITVSINPTRAYTDLIDANYTLTGGTARLAVDRNVYTIPPTSTFNSLNLTSLILPMARRMAQEAGSTAGCHGWREMYFNATSRVAVYEFDFDS